MLPAENLIFCKGGNHSGVTRRAHEAHAHHHIHHHRYVVTHSRFFLSQQICADYITKQNICQHFCQSFVIFFDMGSKFAKFRGDLRRSPKTASGRALCRVLAAEIFCVMAA